MRFHKQHRPLSILTFLVFSFCLFNAPAFGQTEPDKSPVTNENRTTADETFELNIAQERITEKDFARSTSVELSDNTRGNLRVQAGAEVRAENVEVSLRGIYGRVRFRASLESLRRRIERLQITTRNSTAPLR